MKAGFSLVPISLLLSTAVSAGTMGEIAPPSWGFVGTISGGPAWSDSGESQTIFIQPDVAKTFTVEDHSNTLGTIEVFLGVMYPFNPTFSGQLGVAYAASSHVNIHGDIWEDADPDFNDFFYNYHITHQRVALKGKLAADCGYFVTPYLTGSIGAGFNRSYDFRLTPKIFEQLPYPGFESHHKTSFSYTVGVGLQKTFWNNFQAGIGYEFADWGRSHLARAPGQTINEGIGQDHVYTHALQFSLSYII